jgi:hypothetical protein
MFLFTLFDLEVEWLPNLFMVQLGLSVFASLAFALVVKKYHAFLEGLLHYCLKTL